MTRFVSFTEQHGSEPGMIGEIVIDADKVVFLRPERDGVSIHLGNHAFIHVRDSLQNVIYKLNDAATKRP